MLYSLVAFWNYSSFFTTHSLPLILKMSTVSVPLSKSQRRRIRKQKLEAHLSCLQTPSDKIPSNKTPYNNVSSNQSVSLSVVVVEEKTENHLSWQQRCIDHTHYVLKKLNRPRINSVQQLEEVQDDPEMYFRKAFIVYAIRESFNPSLTDSPSVTKEKCIQHCKSLIKDPTCVMKDATCVMEMITDSPLMIYRKSIIKLALDCF